jgi:AcrR family transcriptional regulator
MALADDKGLDAVSMRAVAERTGVTPMALYPHIGSKAELLEQMAVRLTSELLSASQDAETPGAVLPAEGGRDWRERLRGLAHAGRRLVHDHPWAASLVFSLPSGSPEMLLATDQIYAGLLEAGVPESEVPRLERMLTTVVLGYAASEAGGRFRTGELEPARRDRLRAATRGGALPTHLALARWLQQPVDWDAEFEHDLDDLLLMVEIVASGRK